MPNVTTDLSAESSFRSGIKEAGFTSADFLVRYQKASRPNAKGGAVPEKVQVKRISTSVTCTYSRGEDMGWVQAALAQLAAGVFGGK